VAAIVVEYKEGNSAQIYSRNEDRWRDWSAQYGYLIAKCLDVYEATEDLRRQASGNPPFFADARRMLRIAADDITRLTNGLPHFGWAVRWSLRGEEALAHLPP
jgi:hypothetical protein